MRTIKFRAWDKKNGCYVDCMTQHYNFLTAYNNGTSDWVLEQFTGLHDSEGKEIYEGDLLKYELHTKPLYKRVVTYEKGTFGYRDMVHQWNILGIEQGNKPDNKKFKVIGNIHES